MEFDGLRDKDKNKKREEKSTKVQSSIFSAGGHEYKGNRGSALNFNQQTIRSI